MLKKETMARLAGEMLCAAGFSIVTVISSDSKSEHRDDLRRALFENYGEDVYDPNEFDVVRKRRPASEKSFRATDLSGRSESPAPAAEPEGHVSDLVGSAYQKLGEIAAGLRPKVAAKLTPVLDMLSSGEDDYRGRMSALIGEIMTFDPTLGFVEDVADMAKRLGIYASVNISLDGRFDTVHEPAKPE